jgi:hypothetical protein
MASRNDVWQLADEIQMDLRNAQAKLTRLRSLIAQRQPFASLVQAESCPECGCARGVHAADCTTLERSA